MYFFLQLVCLLTAAAAASPRPRIVGGLNATILEAPWQATLHYYPVNICGGTIIREDAILTASHCFAEYGTDREAYHIRVGNTKRSVGGEVYRIKEIITHPDFDKEHYNADVAIVKLATNITFSERVKPIPLASASETLKVGKKGMITGWGKLEYNGNFPILLQKAFLPIIDQEVCGVIYQDMRNITKNMFCAGTFDGKTDACNGDSGGPFVLNNKLFGIVSWGIQCAMPEYPGVFTFIPNLRSWIDKNLN